MKSPLNPDLYGYAATSFTIGATAVAWIRERKNGVDPKVEEPARELIGYAIGGELDQLADPIEAIGGPRFLEAGSLCVRIAGYIAIDACGR